MRRATTEKKALRSAMIRAIVRVFWQHLRRYPKGALIILIASIGTTTLEIVGALYSKKLFDTLAAPGLAPAAAVTILVSIVITLYGFIKLTDWALFRFWDLANAYVQAHVMEDIENTSFDNLLGHSYRFFTNTFTGSLVRKVRRLSRAFENTAEQVQSRLIPLTVAIIGVLAILFHRHLILGAALFIWVLFFVTLYSCIAFWKLKYDRAKAEKDSETTGVLSDALTNVVTIKLFSHYEHEKGRFAKALGELTRLRLFTWRINLVVDAMQGGFMLIINFLVIYIAIFLWRDGKLSVGDFALIEGVLMTLFHRIWDFGRVIRQVYESLADASEMVEILDTPHEIRDRHDAAPLVIKNGKIEFRNVEFGFRGSRKILDQFHLTMEPGQKIALVGPSGAGKTTVVALLFRFHDLTSGTILIDGQDIAGVTQESLRRQIALVPQEPILFHRTIKENITYGKLEATGAEIQEAAKRAHCHEFISQLPYGYETYVGERGVKLSGGERQRIAIARAILANKPILILDEATSSLDSAVEAHIQDALRTLMRGKTVIVIAHRLSTIRTMDRIIIIEEGKAAREGTHDELLQEEGIYKKLWEIQAGGFVSEQ